MDRIFQDLRIGIRALSSHRNTSAIAVLCLALGIGANTAIFSVVNTVLLRPLAYAEPGSLVRVYETFRDGNGWGAVSEANYADWREQNRVFAELAATSNTSLSLQGTGDPERLRVVTVTANAFDMLGVKPRAGRAFLAGDDARGSAHVVVLSEALWMRRFGGDPSLVGRSITLDGDAYTVLGVMPARFDFPTGSNADLWAPLVINATSNRGAHSLAVYGRLKPGVTIAGAATQMKQIAARLAKLYPDEQGDRGVRLTSLQQDVVGDVRPALFVLLGAVGFVLLIACANVANLLLARAAGRRKDVAIRTALGASRARLVTQFLAESVVLAFAGGALGLGCAMWGTKLLVALAGTSLPRATEVHIDATVFAFLLLVCVITGVGFGLVPALHATRADLRGDLTDGGRGGSVGPRQQRVRSVLVVVEVALALVLLVGSGLLMRGFLALQREKPGLTAAGVLTLHLSIPVPKYPDGAAMRRFYDPLFDRIRAIPGVRAAGMTNVLPIENWGWNGTFSIEGRPAERLADQPFAELRRVSTGYFDALRIPVRRGRDFTRSDDAKSNHVALINEALAKRYFPREDPIGRRVGDSSDWYTIVGVVGDVRQSGLDREPLPELYFDPAQDTSSSSLGAMTVAISTTVDPASITGAVRDAVRAVDPTQPVYRVRTMERVISESLTNRELYLWLLGIFATIALALAVAGIYGVMSYLVTQRTREIGIRMALGARTGDVLGLVVRQGMRLALAGIAAGVVAALGLTRLLRGLLYGVSTTDAATFAVVAVMLTLVALVASWIPARRAAMVDPNIAMRSD